MSKNQPKKRPPAAFDLAEDDTSSKRTNADKPETKPRAARALPVTKAVIAEDDFFETEALEASTPLPIPASTSSWLGRMFLAGASILITSALALWTDQLVRDLFARADWLGWLALGAAALAGFALLIFILKEFRAVWSQASIAKLQQSLQDAYDLDNLAEANKAVASLRSHTKNLPEAAKGRATLESLDDTIMDAKDRIALAERELLTVLDQQALTLVRASAQRVSVVTAVSPRALVDVTYVIIENMRLIRMLSLHYGGRPGTFGLFRLARSVVGHLAITGSIAVGDTIIQQFIGQGLAAKLSARLGEGVVNGLMTVRVGIAAIEVTRPAPFIARPRPKVSEFARILTQKDDKTE